MIGYIPTSQDGPHGAPAASDPHVPSALRSLLRLGVAVAVASTMSGCAYDAASVDLADEAPDASPLRKACPDGHDCNTGGGLPDGPDDPEPPQTDDDLQASGITIQVPVQGGRFHVLQSVSFIASNNGPAPSPPVDAELSVGGTVISTIPVPVIPPGGSTTLTFSAPTALWPGVTTISAKVDASNALPELSETNNVSATSYTF